jgi:hypothetical protein
LEVVANAGVMAIAGMLVGLLPLIMGIAYAIWPTEQRLTLMRTLSLATVFAAIAGVTLGFIYELRFINRSGTVAFSGQVASGIAEGLVPVFFDFGCLAVAWLCVTLGLWRRP